MSLANKERHNVLSNVNAFVGTKAMPYNALYFFLDHCPGLCIVARPLSRRGQSSEGTASLREARIYGEVCECILSSDEGIEKERTTQRRCEKNCLSCVPRCGPATAGYIATSHSGAQRGASCQFS